MTTRWILARRLSAESRHRKYDSEQIFMKGIRIKAELQTEDSGWDSFHS